MRLSGKDDLAGALIDREAHYKLYEQKSGAASNRKRLFFARRARQRENGGELF